MTVVDNSIYLKGTHMHIDPLSTDAFNALFIGHKWWVYLPPDVYEFDDELTCDQTCSDIEYYHTINNKTVKNFVLDNEKNALWFAHILPQIR